MKTIIDYNYLNNYFGLFQEDAVFEDSIDQRDLTPREYQQLVEYLKRQDTYNHILEEIEQWEQKPCAQPVMSEHLQDLCLEWFDNNIELETEE